MSAALGLVAGFLRFWYDFIVGDDWTIAAGVVLTATTTFVAARHGVEGWAVMPVGAIAVLVLSLWRARRTA